MDLSSFGIFAYKMNWKSLDKAIFFIVKACDAIYVGSLANIHKCIFVPSMVFLCLNLWLGQVCIDDDDAIADYNYDG